MPKRDPWFLFAVDGDDWRQLRQLSVRRGRALRAASHEQRYFNGTLVIVQKNEMDEVMRHTAKRPPAPAITDDQIEKLQQAHNRSQLTPTKKVRR